MTTDIKRADSVFELYLCLKRDCSKPSHLDNPSALVQNNKEYFSAVVENISWFFKFRNFCHHYILSTNWLPNYIRNEYLVNCYNIQSENTVAANLSFFWIIKTAHFQVHQHQSSPRCSHVF